MFRFINNQKLCLHRRFVSILFIRFVLLLLTISSPAGLFYSRCLILHFFLLFYLCSKTKIQICKCMEHGRRKKKRKNSLHNLLNIEQLIQHCKHFVISFYAFCSTGVVLYLDFQCRRWYFI